MLWIFVFFVNFVYVFVSEVCNVMNVYNGNIECGKLVYCSKNIVLLCRLFNILIGVVFFVFRDFEILEESMCLEDDLNLMMFDLFVSFVYFNVYVILVSLILY